MSPIIFAYIGDAVFELYVRKFLITNHNLTINELNKKAHSIVNATAQARVYNSIEHILTDAEKSIAKRARNAKKNTPKNADMHDYNAATALEATLGYLYLSGEHNRLDQLLDLCKTEFTRIPEDCL